MGRHPETVAALVELAEKWRFRCVPHVLYEFPKQHWGRSTADLQHRDVILIIDHDVPGGLGTDPPRDSSSSPMDADPVHLKTTLMGLSVHIPITCDSSKAISRPHTDGG